MKSRNRRSSGRAPQLPTGYDLEADPEWSQSVYWYVVRKALLAIGLGLAGLILGFFRFQHGDPVGAGIALVGLSLVAVPLLGPTEAEFEFIGRFNHFVLHPPVPQPVGEATAVDRAPSVVVSEQ